MSSILTSFLKDVTIKPSLQSDHSIVILELRFSEFKHGKGLWKHNNSLLKDIEYISLINQTINEVKLKYAVPVYNIDKIEEIPTNDIQFTIYDQLFMDMLLMEIRGKSISYSSYKKKITNNREIYLINEIQSLENTLTVD